LDRAASCLDGLDSAIIVRARARLGAKCCVQGGSGGGGGDTGGPVVGAVTGGARGEGGLELSRSPAGGAELVKSHLGAVFAEGRGWEHADRCRCLQAGCGGRAGAIGPTGRAAGRSFSGNVEFLLMVESVYKSESPTDGGTDASEVLFRKCLVLDIDQKPYQTDLGPDASTSDRPEEP
jgi:hypothetical protein